MEEPEMITIKFYDKKGTVIAGFMKMIFFSKLTSL